ncbi:AAA family ATPase [Ruminococcus sp. HUN007]|uniref:AAA family ATPase n=1 Tax=Ruminococcus sp. HUN007 TaxID=1514668 RepID=UPI0005D212DE|nr:AAA family ATPase [Ruminococcus sp. HUN007]
MGTYLNPGNEMFRAISRCDYVDKTGLIGLMNQRIETGGNLVCISRPRRFGKSYAAQMLAAYYDRSCDSHELFDGKTICSNPTYEGHINKYDVIYIDITGIRPYTDKYRKIDSFLTEVLSEELKSMYPDIKCGKDFASVLVDAVSVSGRKFIFIIDEWDAPVREADAETADNYLKLLRSVFKNSVVTNRVVAAAYMTGILPIKKDGSQSAISDFEEFTMIKPGMFGEYAGFTETEVRDLCAIKNIDFQSMKSWYDGYSLKNTGSIYNPNSVMKAIRNNDFDSYWTETSAADSLMEYISKDYNGLARTIAELIAGIDVPVETKGFSNDLTSFKGKDDVLTLLVHLGYLAYDHEKKTVHIPNEEIKLEFSRTIKVTDHSETLKRLSESERLFIDTVEENEESVAAQIEKIHSEETAPLHYNSEASLRSVIKLAYYTYRDNYVQFEELPSGDGYADIVYLPKYDSGYPILLIELKWNKDVHTAIDQIKERHYPEQIKGFGRDIILVGITYDKDEKPGHRKHYCHIEKAVIE